MDSFYLYRCDRETGAILNLVDSFYSEAQAYKEHARISRIWAEDINSNYIVSSNKWGTE